MCVGIYQVKNLNKALNPKVQNLSYRSYCSYKNHIMKSRFASKLATLIFIFSLFVISCGKENSTTQQEEKDLANAIGEADGEADATFSEFFDDAMGADNTVGVAGSGVFYGRGDTLNPVPRCFTINTIHPTANPFPVIIVVDFGTTGCPGPDGRMRRGKIRTEYTNNLTIPGAIATTTFEDFYVNDIHVEGTHKISNIGTALTRQFKIEVINGKLTRPNGNYTEWNSIRTITQIEGLGTPLYPRDDIFRIEGHANGTARRGNLVVRWESNITEPLIRRFTCRWIVKGRVRAVRVNLPNPANSPWVAILDFGAGGCDNMASLTINGVTRQITLP